MGSRCTSAAHTCDCGQQQKARNQGVEMIASGGQARHEGGMLYITPLQESHDVVARARRDTNQCINVCVCDYMHECMWVVTAVDAATPPMPSSLSRRETLTRSLQAPQCQCQCQCWTPPLRQHHRNRQAPVPPPPAAAPRTRQWSRPPQRAGWTSCWRSTACRGSCPGRA